MGNDNGHPRLITYGYFNRALDQSPVTPAQLDAAEMGKIIKQVCNKAKTTNTKAVSALPAFSVFSSILSLPPLKESVLKTTIESEAKKVVPLPIEQMVLDWKIIDDLPDSQLTGKTVVLENQPGAEANGQFNKKAFLKINPGAPAKNIKILLTAAPKELVKKYIDIFRFAGLELLSLDTEAFALIRSLVGNDKSALMIVDIGSAVTNVVVVINGIPILSRSIQMGGTSITQTIASNLGISLDQAEQFKYDLTLNQSGPEKKLPKAIEVALTPIIDEIKYSLNFYQSRGPKKIEKIILSGGSSLLFFSLPDYLSQTLGLRVYRGDPWARVIYPQDLKPVLDEIGPRFSVAVGLALRNISQ